MNTTKDLGMKTVLHKANSRGHANHGWLDTYHTFSFANYQDRERMNFGVLRVLNDDTVAPGMGFGTHPHRDMEIISIPLEGALEHKDSTGITGVIKKGEIQVMTAGTGVMHSEYNHSKKDPVKFLQIWIFPRELGLTPRGEQMSIKEHAKSNDFQQIVSPDENDEGLWINQDAWFNLANFVENFSKTYKINKKSNGIYIFVIHGSVKVEGMVLEERDGMGVQDAEEIKLEALKKSEILIMEVPMELPDYLVS